MNKGKKMILSSLALCTVSMSVLMTTSCGKPGGGSTKGKIAVITKNKSVSFWDDVKKGSEAAGDELGYDIIYTAASGDNDFASQVEAINDAIKEDVEDALPGVEINLQSMTKAERLDKMQNDNYDIALTRWGPDYADPMTYLGMWITNNSNNYGFWSNAEYDQLIKDCTTGAYIHDYDARWAALLDAETIVMQEAVIAPLYTKANANLIAAGVQGIQFHPVALNRVYKAVVLE